VRLGKLGHHDARRFVDQHEKQNANQDICSNIKPMGGRPAFHEREQFQVPLIDLGQAVEEEDRPERNCGEVRKNQIEKFRITVAAATCFSGCSKR
jgi:hypothetical protein